MANWDFDLTEPEKEVKKKKGFAFKDVILFENEDIIVVNKPADVASLDDRDDNHLNMLARGKRYFPDLKICLRLDKLTTGLLVFAKNAEAYRDISLQMENREAAKHFLAIVKGVRKLEEFEIDEPIYLAPSGVSRVHQGKGKPALTVVSTLETFREYSLLECFTVTARTHQVRVHLAFIGCPIIGDDTYGGSDILLSDLKKSYNYSQKGNERPVNKGLMLHARGLSLRLPGQTEATNFVAPVPEEMDVTLKILRKWGN